MPLLENHRVLVQYVVVLVLLSVAHTYRQVGIYVQGRTKNIRVYQVMIGITAAAGKVDMGHEEAKSV